MKNFRSSRRSACLSAVSASPVMHLDLVVGERRLQAHRELVGGDVGRLGDHDAVEAARLAEQLLGGVEVGGDHRRAGDPVDLAERRLADERELDRAGLGQHGERVADRPALVGHGGAVDDGLVGRFRSAPVGELERVEPRVVDPRRFRSWRPVRCWRPHRRHGRAGRSPGSSRPRRRHRRPRARRRASPRRRAHEPRPCRRRSPIHGGRWRRRLRCWWRARRRTCAPWCR